MPLFNIVPHTPISLILKIAIFLQCSVSYSFLLYNIKSYFFSSCPMEIQKWNALYHILILSTITVASSVPFDTNDQSFQGDKSEH